MDPRLEPGPPDLTLDLSSDTCWQVIHTLRAALPLIGDTPGDAGSTPSQALARRDNAAIARVACLLPANADEADIAAQYIAAGAQAMDCMRLAREHHGEPAIIFRCTALAATMLRQARAMRSLLQRVQAERRKRAADNAPFGQAARADSRGIDPIAQAPTADPGTAAAPSAAPPMQPEATPAAAKQAIAAEADRYALNHRKRAALIRALGRLPDKVDCGALRPEVVRQIATGTSPILRSLDRRGHPARAAAA